MHRWITIWFALCATAAAPAWADVTIKGHTVTESLTSLPGAAMAREMQPLITQLASAACALLSGQDRETAEDAFRAVPAAGEPQTTTEEFTLYLRGGVMRMDSGDGRHTVFIAAHQLSESQTAVLYKFVDHEARQYNAISHIYAAGAAVLTGIERTESSLTPLGENRTYLGHVTSGYSYAWSTPFTDQGFSSKTLFQVPGIAKFPLVMSTRGTAWIAGDVPGIAEIRAFYRSLANGVQQIEGTGTLLSGLTADMAILTERGMPLETNQTTVIGIDITTDGGSATDPDPLLLISSTSTSTVTSVTPGPVDPELFYPNGMPPGYQRVKPNLPPAGDAGPGCDCSCSAYENFKSLTEQRDDKDADAKIVAMAGCAMQCMTKWTACAGGS